LAAIYRKTKKAKSSGIPAMIPAQGSALPESQQITRMLYLALQKEAMGDLSDLLPVNMTLLLPHMLPPINI